MMKEAPVAVTTAASQRWVDDESEKETDDAPAF